MSKRCTTRKEDFVSKQYDNICDAENIFKIDAWYGVYTARFIIFSTEA